MPLEHFRQKHIGGVKEKKKSFYKKTAKYCQAQERFLAMSSKRPENVVIEVSVEGRVHSVMDGNAAIFNDWDSFQFNLITRLDLLSHSQCIWRIIEQKQKGFPCLRALMTLSYLHNWSILYEFKVPRGFVLISPATTDAIERVTHTARAFVYYCVHALLPRNCNVYFGRWESDFNVFVIPIPLSMVPFCIVGHKKQWLNPSSAYLLILRISGDRLAKQII